MNSVMCMICGHGTHEGSHCPDLVADLRVGFYRGGGGGGGHTHDDEEETIRPLNTTKIFLLTKKNEQSSRKMGRIIHAKRQRRTYYSFQSSSAKFKRATIKLYTTKHIHL